MEEDERENVEEKVICRDDPLRGALMRVVNQATRDGRSVSLGHDVMMYLIMCSICDKDTLNELAFKTRGMIDSYPLIEGSNLFNPSAPNFNSNEGCNG